MAQEYSELGHRALHECNEVMQSIDLDEVTQSTFNEIKELLESTLKDFPELASVINEKINFVIEREEEYQRQRKALLVQTITEVIEEMDLDLVI